jgi:hypothetical protein
MVAPSASRDSIIFTDGASRMSFVLGLNARPPNTDAFVAKFAFEMLADLVYKQRGLVGIHASVASRIFIS